MRLLPDDEVWGDVSIGGRVTGVTKAVAAGSKVPVAGRSNSTASRLGAGV